MLAAAVAASLGVYRKEGRRAGHTRLVAHYCAFLLRLLRASRGRKRTWAAAVVAAGTEGDIEGLQLVLAREEGGRR